MLSFRYSDLITESLSQAKAITSPKPVGVMFSGFDGGMMPLFVMLGWMDDKVALCKGGAYPRL
jgi:hypothetical protein